jgi:hypothetical protein
MAEVTAGRARGAAHTLIDLWSQLGSDYADYDVVWRAKEYLFDKADQLEAAVPQEDT